MEPCEAPELVEIEGQLADARLLAACIEGRSSGLRSLAFTDGAAALVYLQAAAERGASPRVVLLDLHLVDEDGAVALARRLQADERTRHTPLIVWSGSSDPGDARRARELGARVFLRKPLDLEGFEAVACLLEGLMTPATAT